MTDYKSIRFAPDFEIGDKVLNIVNDYLSKQPEPRPFIEPSSEGYLFIPTAKTAVIISARDMSDKERKAYGRK